MSRWFAGTALLCALALPTPATAQPGDGGPRASENPRVACLSSAGLVRVEFEQPDNSVLATGAGECWLRVARHHAAPPLRLYVSLSPTDRLLPGPPSLEEQAEQAMAWLRQTRLMRGRMSLEDQGIAVLGDEVVDYFVVRGLPREGHTTVEAVVVRTVRANHDVVIVAHYDAYNRQGFRTRAVAMVEGITLHGGQPARPIARPAALPPDEIEERRSGLRATERPATGTVLPTGGPLGEVVDEEALEEAEEDEEPRRGRRPRRRQ